MADRKVVNRTHFKRREVHRTGPNDRSATWQWYWQTRSNNGQITAVGGESYAELRGAINGFLATHGIDSTEVHDEDTSLFSLPEKFTDDHYVITQYAASPTTTE